MSPRTYLIVWVALLGLTGLTYGAAHVPMGALNTPLAIAIALAKAALIGLVFMHLIHERFTLRFILVGSALFVLLLICAVLLDGSTRYPLATPPGSTRHLEPLEGKLD